MTIVECRGLRKVYARDNKVGLDSLDLAIEQNTVFGYLGPNGAGKTTTIKLLAGLMRPSSGTAQVAGEKVALNSPSLRSKIGYLGQEPNYYGWMTGKQLLRFVAEIFGLSKSEQDKQADELLDISGLAEDANRRIKGYSGGMKQRLGIAQALVANPSVLFLDEPVSSLDPIGRKEVLELIEKLKERTTVFMSTHILADVERVCDVVGIVDKGKIVAVERIEQLKKSYAANSVEIRFENHIDAARLFEAAAESPLVECMHVDEGSVRMAEADFRRYRNTLLKIAANHDLSVIGIETRDATLEEVFIKLVGSNREANK